MLPNKLTDFFDKPAWINRTLFYASIFLSIALIFIIVFGVFNFIFPNFTFPNNAIDYDNERYLLSALVQSLAATIALVITLSLVAVQLAAQSYSARVIDVYKRNPDMWILLCIYIFTIFYGLGLTKIIGLGILGNYMENAIFLAYFMGFFAFVCLVPYMLKTLDLLKPSTLIMELAKNITNENLLKAIYAENNKIDELDPIQPLIDILNSSLMKYDNESIRNCLKAITESTNNLFAEGIDERDEKEVASFVFQHISSAVFLAIEKQNEDAICNLILSMKQNASKAIEMKNKLILEFLIDSFRKIGGKAYENRMYSVTKDCVKAIGKIGQDSIGEKMENVTDEIVIKFDLLSQVAIETKAIYGSEIVMQLYKIGKEGLKREAYDETEQILCELEAIANYAKDSGHLENLAHVESRKLKKEFDEKRTQSSKI
ncbi:DUF2254 family protein [Methanolobus profundi]|uniref:Predicted membrane protein n=1 Tax=Methanolobus profundi TaxID=487685 RepID=A0A1I4R6N7_9EURY|nr:DUF2254 family protein [Methanolobus profundi]SFM47968.1 Predicted membrane protein [Methanolobus profundi]